MGAGKVGTVNRTIGMPKEIDEAVRAEIAEYNAKQPLARAQYKSVVIDALRKRYGLNCIEDVSEGK